jgi:hypothetical protein
VRSFIDLSPSLKFISRVVKRRIFDLLGVRRIGKKLFNRSTKHPSNRRRQRGLRKFGQYGKW